MEFSQFRAEIKSKPRNLIQVDRGNNVHEWGTETWLILKDSNTIGFNIIIPDQPHGICKFTTICTPGDIIRCSYGPDGYELEIENHPNKHTTFFNNFIFSD